MVAIKTVALAGASGNLGPSVLTALLNSGKFDVTVIKRIGSKSAFPSSVKVVEVDYDSLDSLTAAFRGQDAVVSTLASLAISSQQTVLEAAIAAGVKRFLPSEFGSDLADPGIAKLPVFQEKVKFIQYLEEKAKAAPITYTLVRNNAFLDWGLKVGFLFNVAGYKPTIYGDGDKVISATTLASVGQAIVGVLEHPEETKNRAVYVEDLHFSQNQLLDIAKRLTPGKTWEPVYADTVAMEAASNERLAKGLFDAETFLPYILSGIFGKQYPANFQKLDNELLGIKGKTEADLEALLKPLLSE
ncbi:MAG: hypothetical protein M1818_003412 [Claussenomyces sp. TS43310]|nr:MAG: hypothetical protein M1818_003412 [Claussenomyces sp. TS43310]